MLSVFIFVSLFEMEQLSSYFHVTKIKDSNGGKASELWILNNNGNNIITEWNDIKCYLHQERVHKLLPEARDVGFVCVIIFIHIRRNHITDKQNVITSFFFQLPHTSHRHTSTYDSFSLLTNLISTTWLFARFTSIVKSENNQIKHFVFEINHF